MNHEPWQVIESQIVIDAPWCKIRRDTVRLPDGRVVADYYLSMRPDVVVIAAVSADGMLPLVRQYKHGAGEVTLELPAGVFFDGTPEEASVRELREETGWECQNVTRIGEFFDDATKNTNRVYCMLATGAYRAGPQQLEEIEASSGLELVEVSLAQLPELLASGMIKAQSSVASAYRVLAWLSQESHSIAATGKN
jgi:ADP-ribose pyrophosphatase